MTHQFFNGDFPRGQMSCVMRSHADALDGRNKRVFGDAGILGDHLFQHGGDRPAGEAGGGGCGYGRRPASLHRRRGAT